METIYPTLLLMACCTILIGCTKPQVDQHYPRVAEDDPSILLHKPFNTTTGSVNENGIAYEKAVVDLAGITKLILSKSHSNITITIQRGAFVQMELFLETTWMDYRHRTVGSSIRQVRNDVNIQTCIIDNNLAVIVSVGESGKEWSLGVDLTIRIPGPITVEQPEEIVKQMEQLARLKGKKAIHWKGLPRVPSPVPDPTK